VRTAGGNRNNLGGLARGGKVTREKLASYYRSAGLAPFQLTNVAQPFSGVIRLTIDGRMAGQTSPEALTDKLFELLDTDKDARLSRKELADAPRVLAKLDRDDDEMVTAEELVPDAGRGGVQAVAFSPDGRLLAARGVSGFRLAEPGTGPDRAL